MKETTLPLETHRTTWSVWMDRLGPLFMLLIVLILFAIARPTTFVSWRNFEVILLQTAVIGTAALGMTLIIISAGIDLSVASIIAVVAVTVARLLNAGFPPWVVALLSIAVGILCGLINGSVIAFGRIAPFIVTLGTLGILRGTAKGLSNEQMLIVPEQGWLEHMLRPLHEGEQWMILPPGVWVMIVVALLMAGVLRYSHFGRHIVAIGSNEDMARLCGVRVRAVKLGVYGMGGLLAGLAGVMQFTRDNVGNPTTALGYELDVIAAVVIGGGSLAGGRGSVIGSLIGALIMVSIANGCNKIEWISSWMQEIITGAIIVFAVLLDRLRHQRTD